VLLQTADESLPVPPVDLTEVSMTTPVPPLPPLPPPPFPAPPAFVPLLPPDGWMVPVVQATPTMARIAPRASPQRSPENCLVEGEIVERSVFIGVRLAIAGRHWNQCPGLLSQHKSIAILARKRAYPLNNVDKSVVGASPTSEPVPVRVGTVGRNEGLAQCEYVQVEPGQEDRRRPKGPSPFVVGLPADEIEHWDADKSSGHRH